ncbi:MAG: DUF4912 domain-containing protein [Pelatocladus maniniholoensis HA4357-MV3]|jgi:phosphate transport system substrate-binding protein|uniref:DUF4912 domain-containing protein n=1 Tax=Pelatocladus maniniholoensis HA4357-MV3 TaxID=1117104 RepID=A0A9E3LTS3_9NOST|nr:DUF4912 domain-containing protein [Pelatocladus maniniholoensis HA4357-MV3]BAZ65600.1 putative phosphate transport system substrate-binding protein [Fischerella sp. NIES-4106]
MLSQTKSLNSLVILFACSAVSTPLVVSLIVRPLLAQSSDVSTSFPSFPMPQSVPSGTQVQINGTTSMEKINQTLAQSFKARFPGTEVKIAYDGTDASLKALPNGKIDLAAIGRPLTEVEKAQGLVTIPLTRNKIAVIVAKDNSFKGSLTSEQFAQIFRGEITNWSQIGGSSQAIRLVDRPGNSDVRQAFENYLVFQKAPFQTGANAVKLSQDSTQAVIKQLGTDGIGYAIADQVINNPNVRMIPMHEVLPTDPRYPFSQPLLYAYRRSNPSPATVAFLGYATAAQNKQIIEKATVATTGSEIAAQNQNASPQNTSSPGAKTSPGITNTVATESWRGSPWWWLLLLPFLGGFAWLLQRNRGSQAKTVAAPVPASVSIPESRIILTPRNCRNAYAYWEVPDQVKADLQRQGGHNLKLHLYDVTNIEMNSKRPHSVKEFDCNPGEQDLHIPITVDNRDYIVELGYTTSNGHWLTIARSAHVRVPACTGVDNIHTTKADNHILVSDRPVVTQDESRVILVPRNSKNAYAYWEIPETHKAELRRQGGQKLALRIYDTTNIDLERQTPHSLWEFDCDQQTSDLHIPINQSDRDYVAELGYLTNDNRWLKLARSTPVKFPSTTSVESTVKPSSDVVTTLAGLICEQVESPSQTTTTNLTGDVTNTVNKTIARMEATARSYLEREKSSPDSDRTTDDSSTMKNDCRIILVPHNSQDAYAYWEVSDDYKAAKRQQGGRRFVLRVHDVTNLDIDRQPAHSTQQYTCDEHDQDKHVLIPVSDRDYIAELGYYTDDNHWLGIIRSLHVHVPADTTSR